MDHWKPPIKVQPQCGVDCDASAFEMSLLDSLLKSKFLKSKV